MDLDISFKGIECEAKYGRISATLSDIDVDDLNTEDVAKHVSIETFFNSHDEQDIKDYVERNYDWFIE